MGAFSCGKPVPTLPENAPEALLERTCLARRLAGTGAECGLPAAQLLSAIAVVVAGRDQGGVSRPRQHRRALRPRGAQPLVRDPVAERGVAEILRQALHTSRLHPVPRPPPPPASTVRPTTISPSITSSRAARAARPPGRMWSPRVRHAI